MPRPLGPPERYAVGRALLREASAELARLRRIGGPGRRTRRRIARTQSRLALAAALLAPPLAAPAGARTPGVVNVLEPYGLADVGQHAAPTFVDIDGDGDLDAVVGETNGHFVFFANTGSEGAPAFAAPATDPFGLSGVVAFSRPTFADLDGDGDLDAFVGQSNGVPLLFANTGSANAPAFAVVQVNPFGLSDVGFNAAPTFADLDGDGDLDAFLGEFYGNTIFFENTGTAQAPTFAPPVTNPFGLADVGGGAVPAFADLDGDGDLDALVGESYGATIFFENTGSATSPAFAPPATNPFGLAGVGDLASPTVADLDGDGDLDVFVGGFDGRTHLFANTGSASAPAFVTPIELAPDASGFASPAFVDIDGDGDLDAFVGGYAGSVRFFANTGTVRRPSFAAPQVDPFGLLPADNLASPTFGDLDGDGDPDFLVGGLFGFLFAFSNTGSAAVPAFAFVDDQSPFGLAQVNGGATPELVDLDGDGDLDVVTGAYMGETVFFENTGTATEPAFGPPVTNPFGLGDVGGFPAPAFADIEGDGDVDVFVGNVDGDTVFLANDGSPTEPLFVGPATNPFGLARVSSRASPAFADVDGDGDLDAFVGQGTGEVVFFPNLAPACPAAPEPGCQAFAAGSLVVDERRPGKEKVVAKLTKGPELAQAALPDPTAPGGVDYALCLYDDLGRRAAALSVDRAGESCGRKPCWKPLGKPSPDGKGFAYKDPAGVSDGVRSWRLAGGKAGHTSLAAAASNRAKKGETALPGGIAAALAATDAVTIQVQTDGPCFQTTLSDVRKQESDRFKAR
jgi:hypothetical protein